MYEMVKRSIRSALIGTLALGVLSGAANAQEGEEAGQHIQNVLLTFHLVQADGFTDEDPEISEVVSELRKLFNFQGYRLLSTSVFNVGLAPSSSGNTATGHGLQRTFPGDSNTPLTIMAEVRAVRATGSVRAKVTLTDATTRLRNRDSFFGSEHERLPLLETSVTIRDGQRVVVGTPRRSADEPVLFLVVTPRIDP